MSFVTAITNANLTTRKNNVFDQIDIPATVNYLAVARITQEGDDVWANMVIHRDTAPATGTRCYARVTAAAQ